MFDFIKNIIEKGNFELKDIIYKINKMYVENHLTEEQKEELEGLARERANPRNSYAEMDKQLEDIWVALTANRTEVESLKDELKSIRKEFAILNATLKGEELPEEEEVIPEEPEEVIYPEWTQPNGAHDAYHTGDRVMFNGKLVESTIDGNVWSPEVYPQGWKEVSEDTFEESEDIIIEE